MASAAAHHPDVIDAAIVGATIVDPKIVDGKIIDGRIVGGRVVPTRHPTLSALRARHIDTHNIHTELVAVVCLVLLIALVYLM